MKKFYHKSFIVNAMRDALKVHVWAKALLVFAVVWGVSPVCVAAGEPPVSTRYVKPGGTGNGLSWATASGNLQAMINDSPEGGEVWVAGGVYKPTGLPPESGSSSTNRDFAFGLKNKVKVYGGFAGTEATLGDRTDLTILANPSRLSGNVNNTSVANDDLFHVVVSVSDDVSTLLNGFTIDSAYAFGSGVLVVEGDGGLNSPRIFNGFGGGLYCNLSSPTIEKCIFKSNFATYNGGAVYNYKSSPTISKCSFISNKATGYGGAICNEEESSPFISKSSFTSNVALFGGGVYNATLVNPTISLCVFTSNSATQNGGGVYSVGCSPEISNTVFTQNSAASNGGGVYNTSNGSLIVNCLFNDNASQNGGAVYNLASTTSLTNCTFFGNSATIIGNGGAVFNSGFQNNTFIKNSIFNKNTKNGSLTAKGVDVYNEDNGKVTVTYTFLQLSNSSSNYPGVNLTSGFQGSGTGNLFESSVLKPLFVTPANPIGPDNVWATADDGLILQNCSELINVGNNAGNSKAFDISGLGERKHNTTIDMGAYENQFGEMLVALTRDPNGNPYVCVGETTTFTATPTYPGLFPNYEFYLNDQSVQSSAGTTYTISTLKDEDVLKVKLTSQACKANSNTVQMVVHAPVLTTTSNAPVCVDKILTFSTLNSHSSDDLEARWTGPGLDVPKLLHEFELSPAKVSMSGKYRVIVTDKYSCTTKDSITVVVNPLPIPVVSNNSPVCRGQKLELNASNSEVSTANFYTWTGPAFTEGPGSEQKPVFDSALVAFTGTYTVSIQDNNGCISSGTTEVLVNSLPIPSASDNTPVCAGQMLNYFSEDTRATVAVEYLWKGPAFETPSVLQNPVFDSATMAMNGIQTLILTDVNGCVDSTTTSTVVRSLPIPSLSYNDPVCAEKTIELKSVDTRSTNYPNYTYTWRGPLGYTNLVDQNPSLPNATLGMTGTYYLTMADTYGCADSAKINVTVHSLPNITATYNAEPVCVAKTLKFDVKDNRLNGELFVPYTYAWSGNGFSETGTTQSPQILNAAVNMSGTYSITVADVYTCSATATIAVTVHSLPIPSVSYNVEPVCVAKTIKLNVNDSRGTGDEETPYQYAWTGNGFTTTGTVKSPEIPDATVAMSGTYSVTVTDQYTCSATTTIAVEVFSLPEPQLKYNPFVCAEKTLNLESVDLRNPNIPEYEYIWRGPNGYTNLIEQNPTRTDATVGMSGTYYLTMIDAKGCVDSSKIEVVIHSLPKITATYNVEPVCVAKTIKLDVKDSRGCDPDGEGPYQYVWTGAGFTSQGTVKSPEIPNATVSMSGTYSVTVTDKYTCSATTSLPVAVFSLPVPKIKYNDPVCAETTLNIESWDERDLDINAYAYQWRGPLGYTNTADQNPVLTNATVGMSGPYHLIMTDGKGCVDSTSIDITVHSLPVPEVTFIASVCFDKNLELKVKDARETQEPSYAYAWSGPAFSETGTLDAYVFENATLGMSGTYSVTVTDKYTCVASKEVVVAVHALPIPSNVTNNGPLCPNNEVLFTAAGGIGYTWTGPNAFVSAEQNPRIAEATLASFGTYLVTVSNEFSCTMTATTALVIYDVHITQQPVGANLCEGNNVGFTVNSNKTTEASYQWFVNTGGEDFTAITNNELYSGADTKSLSLKFPEVSYGGARYRCAANYRGCLATSDPATLGMTTSKDIMAIVNVVPIESSMDEKAVSFIVALNEVKAGTHVNFQAGNSIELLPGFEAKTGSAFHAKVESPCINGLIDPTPLPNFNYRSIQLTNIAQVGITNGLKVDWKESEFKILPPNVSIAKYKIRYKTQTGEEQFIDNISSELRTFTVPNLILAETYEVEVIEVVRVMLPQSPFLALPYIDTPIHSEPKMLEMNGPPVVVCANRVIPVPFGDECRLTFTAETAGNGTTDPNGDELTYTLNDTGPFGLGIHYLELSVKDPGGFDIKCNFTLEVIDKNAPRVFTKNAGVFLNKDGFGALLVSDVDNQSYDQCQPLSVTKTLSKTLFSTADIGLQEVTLIVTDASGNSASGTAIVDVRPLED
jgi:predicted outer membrane repeat protein